MGVAEEEYQTTCTVDPVTVCTCLQHLSQLHQRIRVGLHCATKTEYHSTAKRCREWSQQRALKIPSNAGMVAAADMVNVQQVRQVMTDVIQHVRSELDETVNDRSHVLNGIVTALQRVTTSPASKPHRTSDFIPRNWDGSNDKGELRHFVSDLHLWMQARSNEGETMLVSVESSDTYDDSTLSVDCSQEHFGINEGSLYQVLHRTTSNEPLRIVQQTKGQRGFEAWRAILRRYDQRNMSDKKSAHAALTSNISERGRAKDLEQFDDILRTFMNVTNKYENKGSARSEMRTRCSQSRS